MADETVMPGAPHGAAADRDPWAPPPSDGPTDSADSPKISLGKTSAPTAPAPAGAPDGRPADGGTGRPAAAPLSAPAPWAAPGAMAGPGTGDAPGAADGPGHTVFSSGPPAPASVHEQQTLASAPGGTDAAQRPGAWSEPNPFAPPQPGDPRAANPFAPPGPAYGEPVPPPPIAPEGPGQVPYGYPGGYGYPGAAGPGGAHGPQGGYYGWPGMQPLPSNGMGTAGLVLGIISAVVFCAWPLAIIGGVLGVIFGAIGRAKAKRGEATNPGQALAGIICGAAGIVLGIGFVILLIVAR